MGTDEAPFLPVLWGPTVDFDDSGAPVFHRVRQLLKVGIGDGCHFSCNAAIRSAWVCGAGERGFSARAVSGLGPVAPGELPGRAALAPPDGGQRGRTYPVAAEVTQARQAAAKLSKAKPPF